MSSPMSKADATQVLKGCFDDNGNLRVVDGFVAGAVGRKITITADSDTVDIIAFLEGATQLMEYTITYNNSAHDVLLSIERTA